MGLRLHQPPFQWVLEAFPRRYSGRSVYMIIHLHLVPRLITYGATPPLSPPVFMPCSGTLQPLTSIRQASRIHVTEVPGLCLRTPFSLSYSVTLRRCIRLRGHTVSNRKRQERDGKSLMKAKYRLFPVISDCLYFSSLSPTALRPVCGTWPPQFFWGGGGSKQFRLIWLSFQSHAPPPAMLEDRCVASSSGFSPPTCLA